MPLPPDFQFSQSSLQAFVDCARRFQLLYIEQLAWPAIQTEPALESERHLQLGAEFHRLLQQYFLGLPPQQLERIAGRTPELARWWESFISDRTLQAELEQPGIKRLPEYGLSMPFDDFRLVGKFDLLLVRPDGRATIYDWKTSRKQPKRAWLAENLQTSVYPFLLHHAGQQFNDLQSIAPDQIEMVYWFADFPSAPLRFPYSSAQQAADKKRLQTLVDEIKQLGEEPAALTDETWRCKYCVYRSLCDRGLAAGPLDELEGDMEGERFDFDLDFDQVEAIEF